MLDKCLPSISFPIEKREKHTDYRYRLDVSQDQRAAREVRKCGKDIVRRVESEALHG